MMFRIQKMGMLNLGRQRRTIDVAAVLLILWLAGMALGRGAGAGRHHFYRW